MGNQVNDLIPENYDWGLQTFLVGSRARWFYRDDLDGARRHLDDLGGLPYRVFEFCIWDEVFGYWVGMRCPPSHLPVHYREVRSD